MPPPAEGSIAQIVGLARQHDIKDALLLAQMEATPQAVWFTGTTASGAEQTPAQVAQQVRRTMFEAALQRAVPVLVIYDIPGRDCSQYSAGGAPTDAAYRAWVDGFAQGVGNGKAVVIVEPDSLANLPSDCAAGAYSNEAQPPTDATRIADIAYDVTTLEQDPNTSVYLDAGNSDWQSVGTIAETLVEADVAAAQGFVLNVSNYQYTQNSVDYGTWVSDCITYITTVDPSANNLTDADNDCPNQYYNGGPFNSYATGVALSPFGVWSDGNSTFDLNTEGIDQRYAAMLGSVPATTHFVIDTSRNGQGPNSMAEYSAAPYNQPASPVISTLQSGNWCNPPDTGLGLPPTADPAADASQVAASPLVDAYLWVKTPGQSDGQCDAAGGVRAWDNSAYTPPISGWPAAGTTLFDSFDPLWSLQTGSVITDPAAGAWFPQQALELAQLANPPLPSR